MPYIKRFINTDIFAILFFVVFFILGISIYQDYGISWDEPTQRGIGEAYVNYINGSDQKLLEMKDRFYGPTYEILLIKIEEAIHPATLKEVYFTRHLVTFLTFFVGVIFFYFLSKNIYKQSLTALLGSIALVLSPRIFDNAFYNTKDIPLLVFFIVCFMFLFYFLDTKKLSLLIIIAIFSAIAITIRTAGMIIPCLTIIAVVYNHLGSPLSLKQKKFAIASNLALFLGLFALLTFLLWPILWSDPVGNFLQAVNKMSHFEWASSVLFMGTYYHSDNIPRIYSVVWILISTPLLYSLLFFVGTMFVLLDIKKVFTDARRIGWGFLTKERVKLFFIAGWFFVPLLLVIIMKSVLYDSWRHLFFIYPAFILLAFWGLEKSVLYLNQKFGRSFLPSAAVYFALLVSFGFTARFMIQAHPYEQLYFNRLAGSSLRQVKLKYELDYWGLAYRKGLEYIAQNDKDPIIPYIAEADPGYYTFILPEADQKRLVPTEDERQAKYLITNYRFEKTAPPYPEAYSVQVGDAKILSVFKLK